MLHKWIVVTLCLGLGMLQAWDSGVLGAGTGIQLLVGVAIALPIVALLATDSYGVHALAVVAAFVLLTVARVTSPVSLPTLHIVAFIPAVLIFFSKVLKGAQSLPRRTV
jgi:hypothetical protein